VVALIIRDARSGHRGLELMCLCHGKHGHVTAVAPTCDANAIGVNRRNLAGFVYAGKDVAQIPVTKIADVGASEGFAVSKASTRVWEKHEIARGRERHAEITARRPGGLNGRAWTAMYGNDQRILLARVKPRRIHQPALHFEPIRLPVNALG